MTSDFRRLVRADGYAVSIVQHQPGVYTILDVTQRLNDRRPTTQTRQQLALLHRQVAPLVGTGLVTEGQRGLHGLSPRLRQTLERALAGDAEKQIAAHLGLSPPTVHEYLGAIYRHFGVESRAELMAYFVRRRPAPICRNPCGAAGCTASARLR